MRLITRYFLIFAAAVVMGGASLISEANATDSKALHLKHKAEAQIERAKAARERADARLTLSKFKSSVQTRRAQEDLIRQVEMLERIRELMQEQMTELAQSGNPVSPDMTGQMVAAMGQIDAQVAQTRSLINQLESQIQAEEAGTSTNGNCYDATKNPWGVPCGNGAGAQDASLAPTPPGTPVAPPPLPAPS